MDVAIISIGNELLIGDTVNTNATWLGRFFSENGCNVTRVLTIPDEHEVIYREMDESLKNADLTVATGGLGPTHDDITKKTVADLFNCGMVRHDKTLAYVQEVFERRGFVFSESNYAQADVPEAAEVLFNSAGTAPGMWLERDGRYLAILPGVPFEMKYLTERHIWPKVEEIWPELYTPVVRYLKTAGIGESTLSDLAVGNLDDFLDDNLQVAYLPSPSGVVIRITGYYQSQNEREPLMERLDELESYIKQKAGGYIYSDRKEDSLENYLGRLLPEKNLSLTTAESCTGGALANHITDIPGSSNYFYGGWVVYSNDLKEQQLGVSREVLEKHGAVSKPVALQLARAAAQKAGADIGVSTTGVAGPGGGTEEKPVGTVWIGFWSKEHHFAVKPVLTKDRHQNKERSVHVALELIRRVTEGIENMPYDLEPQFPDD